MGIMRALALLGGVAGGVSRELDAQEDRKRRVERENKQDAWREEQQGRQRKDWAKQDAEDAALSEAASTDVKDGTTYQPAVDDDGNAMPANPTAGTFKMGGQRFATEGEAKTAAADPMARTQRMASAVAPFNPERAAAIETSGVQGEAARMQMRAGKLKEADDAFNRQLFDLPAQDWGALEKHISDSKGDNQGGALKVKFVPSADGKTMAAHRVNADGTTTVTPWTFGNTQDGFQTALGVIGMRMPAEQKLAHMHGMAKTDEERKRWQVEFDARRTDSDRNYQLASNRDKRATAHEARMAAAAERSARAAESKTAGQGGLTMADLKDGHKSIAATLTADYKSQLDDVALDEKGRGAIRTTREREIADVQRIYTGAMSQGMPMTPEQAIAAFRTGKRVQVEVPDSAGKKHSMEAISVNGRLIPMANEPGSMAPAQAPATAPAAAPSKAAPAPAKTAAAPAPVQITPQQRAAEIVQALQRDTALKEGGLGGIGMRMIKQRTMPLGVAERAALEQELAQIQGR